ncbi:MAG: hypothetical protein K5829_13420 [Treponema sp.]|nr:hypothetical protein [Treponema sp.]
MILDKRSYFYIIASLLSFIVFFLFRQFPESIFINVMETVWMLLYILCAVLIFDGKLVQERKPLIKEKSKKKLIVVVVLLCLLTAKTICSIYVRHITKTVPSIGKKELLEYVMLYFVAGLYEELMFKRGVYGILCRLFPHKLLAMILCSAVFFMFHFRFSFMSVFSLMLYQLFTLGLFELYPDIFTFGIFHALWNISLWI